MRVRNFCFLIAMAFVLSTTSGCFVLHSVLTGGRIGDRYRTLYGNRMGVGCSPFDIDCQRAAGEREGIERALREQAVRARQEGRRAGYCEYGGVECK